MPDIDQIKALIELAFNSQVSPLIIRTLVICLFVWLTLQLINGCRDIFYNYVKPFLSSDEAKRRNKLRRIFAWHIVNETERLNRYEAWSDYRFTELEAEVEAEGLWKTRSWLPLVQRTRRGVRRIRSLSKALEMSAEKYILVEGEPGSGKSVALRYVAKQLAQKATKDQNNSAKIPIYVNLKELERANDEVVDRSFIEKFILETINRINDRDIDTFLDQEFATGLREGAWLFLFDSFDEIPEVLSSTEADTIIRMYADALADFLYGMNQCRGIIASRQFRGPKVANFKRFTVLALTEERKISFVKRATLPKKTEHEILGHLGMARQEIKDMTKNPMFLGLLCQHIADGHAFPLNGHAVFETYVDSRINRDANRVFKRFGLTPTDLRYTAEMVAFSMLADTAIGLNPNREQLMKAIIQQNLTLPLGFDTTLDALEYIKIARPTTNQRSNSALGFTFAHRRFQEYFATNVVLREPYRVTYSSLLLDARWRETAVVIFQTQDVKLIGPILQELRLLLSEATSKISFLTTDILMDNMSNTNDDSRIQKSIDWPWPPHILHVISLVQDGFVSRADDVPEDIQSMVADLLLPAYNLGILRDKKWSLEVAGVAPQPILLTMIRSALSDPSQILKDVTYYQVARLKNLPSDVVSWILKSIVDLASSGRLMREKYTIKTHVSRLDNSKRFINTVNLLLMSIRIDTVIYFLLFTLLCVYSLPNQRIISITKNQTNLPLIFTDLFGNKVIYYLLALACFYFSYKIYDDFSSKKFYDKIIAALFIGLLRFLFTIAPLDYRTEIMC